MTFDFGASFFEFAGQLFGCFFVQCFLDRLGCAFDQVLGFFEAQTGGFAHGFDDSDFLAAVALEDHVESSLLFGFFRHLPAAPATITVTTSGGLDAVLFFQVVRQIDSFLEGQADQAFGEGLMFSATSLYGSFLDEFPGTRGRAP